MKAEAYFDNILQKLLEELDEAQESIYIAVAWFTHEELFDIILKKAKENVKVHLIYIDDHINRNKLDFTSLSNEGAKVFIYPSSDGKGLMHNKFCIIDQQIVITGSYNWTYLAPLHQENIQITKGSYTLGSEYILQFWKIVEKNGCELINAVQVSPTIRDENSRKRVLDFLSGKRELTLEIASDFSNISEKVLHKFKDEWDWKGPEIGIDLGSDWFYLGLSSNKSLPWSLELIREFKDKWDWEKLSYNERLPWSLELIREFKDKWDWEKLSSNRNLSWTIELIRKFKDKWDWEKLSSNENLPWSIELIREYEDKWIWEINPSFFSLYDVFGYSLLKGLSGNGSLPWTVELIKKYEDKWIWSGYRVVGLSGNRSLPWTLELIKKYEDKWDWKILSGNESLPWTLELIREFKDKWNWDSLSYYGNLPWSIELIREFKDKWNWKEIGENKNTPWSNKFLFNNYIRYYDNNYDNIHLDEIRRKGPRHFYSYISTFLTEDILLSLLSSEESFYQ